MGVLFVTGMLNARHVFHLSQHVNGEVIRQVHSFAAYWGLALIGIHIALHWEMIWGALCKSSHMLRKSRRAFFISRSIVFLCVMYGIWAFADRDMGAKLFLGFSFDYWETDRSIIFWYTNHMAILGLYVISTQYMLGCLKADGKKMPKA